MSLTKMNYSISDKVIDIYSGLLGTIQLSEKYCYSDMKGYDIIDIVNSLSLLTAYRVYDAYKIDAKKIEEFGKYASEDQSAIFQYFIHFIPNDEKLELDMLDKLSPEFLYNSAIIVSNPQESDAWKATIKTENISSFLDFCLHIKRDERYWERVYQRLNLEWETEDKYDRIYCEIKKEQKKDEVTITLLKEPIIEDFKINKKVEVNKNNIEVSMPSLYEQRKTEIIYLVSICIFIWGLSNIPVRNISFSIYILLSALMIFMSWRGKVFDTNISKFNFALSIFTVILLMIGIFNFQVGYYAAMFCILTTIFGLGKHFITTRHLSCPKIGLHNCKQNGQIFKDPQE